MKFAPVIHTPVRRFTIDERLTDVSEAVIDYKGRRYAVRVEVRINDDTPEGCDVQFVMNDSASLTEDQIGTIKGSHAKWGGSPRFLQNEFWPVSNAGIQYDYLCTIDNEWGDFGNCNIFILTECDTSNWSYQKNILSMGRVAKICNVAPRTATKWFDSGYLKGYRIPGSNGRRVPRENLVEFLKKHNMPLNGLEQANTMPSYRVIDSFMEASCQ